jgi:hypothetical protein
MFYLLLTYLPSILCAIHAVRTRQEMYWIWLLVIAPGLGPLIYFFAVIAPGLFGGRTARRVGGAAVRAMDPEREYRLAKQALEETPTIGNRARVADAALMLGRASEAEPLYRESLIGQFADDPAILMGHARALLELQRYQEALDQIERLHAQNSADPEVALAYARAYEGLRRFDEADAPYRFAADRIPGLEGAARYVAFMAKAGRTADARTGLDELNRRLPKIPSHFRAEARRWRDYAAHAVNSAARS